MNNNTREEEQMEEDEYTLELDDVESLTLEN
jgi:hypothetical protein